MSEFAARVTEVISGDTIMVSDAPGSAERRISLSSLRCPRMGKEPEPYAVESKEALRDLFEFYLPAAVKCAKQRVSPVVPLLVGIWIFWSTITTPR